MARVLVTGMSGTGKSTVLAELADRDIPTVDTDYGDWSQEVPDPTGRGLMQVWRAERINLLLETHASTPLVVSGTVSNQGQFYDRFEAVVLLTAPVDVILHRVRHRTTNHFGQNPADIERILLDFEHVQPLLRAGCTVEIDATQDVHQIADEIECLTRMSGHP
jgi:dephospho-CoA kinase